MDSNADIPIRVYDVYLFVAHTLGAPNEALGAAVLAGAVTALIGLFCIGLVQGTWVPSFLFKIFIQLFRADTLYLCYCIDEASRERRGEELFVASEYGATRKHARQLKTITSRSPLFNADSDSEDVAVGGRKAAAPSTAKWDCAIAIQGSASKSLPPRF